MSEEAIPDDQIAGGTLPTLPYSLGLTVPEEDPEENFFFKILINQLEQSYILGRITKEELIKGLSQLYEMNSGLDMAELIEEIEIAKESFYDDMMDKLLKELEKRNAKP